MIQYTSFYFEGKKEICKEQDLLDKHINVTRTKHYTVLSIT